VSEALEVRFIPLSSIVEWLEPREFSEEDVKNMAMSLRIHGQIENITVEPLDEKAETFRGITGRLRYEGAKHAKIMQIECKIKRFKSESERVGYQLAENLHRKDLTALQRAEWYKRYRDTLKQELPEASSKSIMTAITESTEKLTGEKASEDVVYRYIEIAEQLPTDVKNTIGLKSNVGLAHCREMLRLQVVPEKQKEIAEKIRDESLTVQKLKREVDEALGLVKPEMHWKCDFCGHEFIEETKTQITLCPLCVSEFQVWHHERMGEQARTDSEG